MKVRTFLSFFSTVIFLVGVASSPGLIQAQTSATLATEASRMDSLAASQGQNKVIDKITGDFSSFYGADTRNIVFRLHNGTPIQLTTTDGTQVTVTPAGKMGFGNVFITMALAKEQLTQMGYTQPTPTQLQGAFQEILNLRASGMGWGEIAHQYNLNLGKAVSGLKASNNAVAATTSSSSTGSGVVTGSGKALGNSEKGAEAGQGIVTGSGRPVGSEGGIVTGRGNAPGVSGGGPGSAGQAKGH